MFHLSGLPALDPFGGYPATKHPAARHVRTLPALESSCSLRYFVELWTVMSQLRFNTNSNHDEYDDASHRPSPPSCAGGDNSSEQTQIRKRRRPGERVLHDLPYQIIVYICQFLQLSSPVLAFVESNKDDTLFELVEGMSFCLSRVVSFYLKLSINGYLLEDSKLFLNPNMTIGVSWGETEEEQQRLKKDKKKPSVVPARGVVLFDPVLTRMKTSFDDTGYRKIEYQRIK